MLHEHFPDILKKKNNSLTMYKVPCFYLSVFNLLHEYPPTNLIDTGRWKAKNGVVIFLWKDQLTREISKSVKYKIHSCRQLKDLNIISQEIIPGNYQSIFFSVDWIGIMNHVEFILTLMDSKLNINTRLI